MTTQWDELDGAGLLAAFQAHLDWHPDIPERPWGRARSLMALLQAQQGDTWQARWDALEAQIVASPATVTNRMWPAIWGLIGMGCSGRATPC